MKYVRIEVVKTPQQFTGVSVSKEIQEPFETTNVARRSRRD